MKIYLANWIVGIVPVFLLVGLLLCWCLMVEGAEPTQAVPPKDTFFFIPHTHWEGAVFKTREEYLDMGLPNILRALKLLKAYPSYRFVLDQVCYVRPFLERYPEEEASFRQFIKEGRLAIVGGTDVMLDVNMPGGESYVRQVLYGKGYYRRKLGVDVTIGWQLDTFGHHAQMPQLLKLGGYKSFWFFRGVPDWKTPSEFFWEGLDGSRIPAFWLPEGYAVTYGSPKTLPEFAEFIKKQFDSLTAFSKGNARVGLAGADVSEPEEQVPPMVEEFNRQAVVPFNLRLGVPGEFEAAVAQRPDRPVLKIELNPIFQGIYSSRIELKQRTRELERLLTTAEKLGVLERYLGNKVDDEILWKAWEPMLFNQAHDLMSGVMTDHVYEDTIRSYDFSRRIARDEVQSRLQKAVSKIDTQGEGIALVVFNSLSWPRTDIATANVGFSEGTVRDLKMIGPDGLAVPVQILERQRYADGALLQAQICFVARNIPAMGYSIYHLVPLRSATPDSSIATPSGGEGLMENEHFRVKLDLARGAITSLVMKEGNWEVLGGPANVVTKEDDHGDLWEPYHPLDGGSRIAMKNEHPAPQKGQAVFSTDQTETLGSVHRGPVFAEYTVAHPFGEKGKFSTCVRVYKDLRRIDIRTKILNQDKFVRYRVLFPTSISKGQNVHEIPYGAIQRPAGIEFPAQNWIDYSDNQRGLALLNRGLPGNNVANGVMMLSLLRCTSIVAYGFAGGYEPGMSSDSGYELGKELTFDYSLVPHGGDWRQAGIYREGLEFNHPLIVHTASSHPGEMPSRWGLLEIDHPNVVVSTLKEGPEESAVLRIYEAAGQAAHGTKIKLPGQVESAEEVNLMEDPGTKITLSADTLHLDLKPFEIKTIKLNMRRKVAAGK
jgi:alpha-mannosidase